MLRSISISSVVRKRLRSRFELSTDPIKYSIMGYEVSLRASEADLVEVVKVSPAEAVCAGKIDNVYAVVTVDKISFFGIDSHAAIVPHMLLGAGCHIEQRSLAAIRIPYQSHIYYMPLMVISIDIE